MSQVDQGYYWKKINGKHSNSICSWALTEKALIVSISKWCSITNQYRGKNDHQIISDLCARKVNGVYGEVTHVRTLGDSLTINEFASQ